MSRRMSGISPRSSPKKNEPPRSSKLFYLVLHECEESGATSLSTIKKRSELMEHKRIPGYIRQSHETTDLRVGEFTKKGRHIVIGMKNLVCLMHKKKVTLNGNFSLRNLSWVSSVRQVKFRRIKCDAFLPFTPEGGDKDFKAIALAVEHLFDECDLPWDLIDWLDLLKHDAMDELYLVKNHMALKSCDEKVSHYIHLYGIFEQLEELMEQGDMDAKKRYDKILKDIPVGNTTENRDWKGDVQYNKYLKEVYHFGRKEYSQSSGCAVLLKFGRHCTQHLMKKSVRNSKIKFSYGEIYWIIEAAIPGLFHQFQCAMVTQGLEDFGDH